jgi:pimeloyl-ACP methyl ester carboxylesterase
VAASLLHALLHHIKKECISMLVCQLQYFLPPRTYSRLQAAVLILAILLMNTACGSSPLPMQAEQFEIASKDGKTKITGEINYRGVKARARPTVFLVHGTGPSHRDYLAQDGLADARQFTPRHNMFLTIAEALTQEGYAVVRYDTRGVRCSQLSCPGCMKNPQPARWGELCVDNKVRLTASLAAIIEDIQSVHEHAVTRLMVDKSATAFITHSAGSVYLGPLVQNGAVAPRLVINIGGLVESPYDAFLWQNSEWVIGLARKCDTDGDGILKSVELNQCTVSPLLKAAANMALALGERQMSLAEIEADWLPKRKLNLREHAKILASHGEEERNQSGGIVAGAVVGPASYQADLSNDRTAVIERYADMTGKLMYYWGSNDVAVSAEREKRAIPLAAKRPKQLQIREFPGLGHCLGKDELVGPMDDSVMPFLREDLRAAFR